MYSKSSVYNSEQFDDSSCHMHVFCNCVGSRTKGPSASILFSCCWSCTPAVFVLPNAKVIFVTATHLFVEYLLDSLAVHRMPRSATIDCCWLTLSEQSGHLCRIGCGLWQRFEIKIEAVTVRFSCLCKDPCTPSANPPTSVLLDLVYLRVSFSTRLDDRNTLETLCM